MKKLTPLPNVRLFIDAPITLHDVIELQQKQAHYLTHVMRRREGDRVMIFNGQHGEWNAKILEMGKKKVSVRPLEQTRPQTISPDCWLICAPLKSGHMEVMIEKASELGVREIHPIKTRHLALKKINPERLSAIAAEAAEQCERLDVPPVHAMKDIAQFLGDHPSDPAQADFRPIFYGDETGHAAPFNEAIQEYCHPGECRDLSPRAEGSQKDEGDPVMRRGDTMAVNKWAVLVGPEGGFAPNELEQLRAHPACIGVCLGPRILRADTASTTLLSLTMAAFGDWDKKPAFRSAENPVTPSS